MEVLKFGGTSMGSVEALEKVAYIIEQKIKDQKKIVVTCSAMSKITDQLLEIGQLAEKGDKDASILHLKNIEKRHAEVAETFGVKEAFIQTTESLFEDLKNLINGIVLIHELSERSIAYLSSFGERLSTRLLSVILQSREIPAQQFDSLFIKTLGKSFWEDDILWEETYEETKKALEPVLEANKIPIVTGFFGTNAGEKISLLGRGGSDFTGAILAVSLGISKVEIWTDVDGFLSADPRIVPKAQIIKEIGFAEASELCFFGAKVLHPKTIRPVIENHGEVWIKNTFAPEKTGTKIAKTVTSKGCPLASITSKKVSMIALDIFGSAKEKRIVFAELFTLANNKEVFIDMIAASEAQISFCVEDSFLRSDHFLKELEKIAPVQVYYDRKIVCMVSPSNVQGVPGLAAQFFEAISGAGVNIEMYSQNASEISQLVVVKEEEANKAIAAIHKQLVENNPTCL